MNKKKINEKERQNKFSEGGIKYGLPFHDRRKKNHEITDKENDGEKVK